MSNVTKSLLGITFLVVVSWLAFTAREHVRDSHNEPESRVEEPELRVETLFNIPLLGNKPYLRITNVGRMDVEVQTVTFNNRPNCTTNYANIVLPQKLKMGEVTAVAFDCLGDLVEAEIVTDRGIGTFKIGGN